MEPIDEDFIEFQVDREMSGLYAKIETLRSENEWLRQEINRLQDLAFDRAAEIAALHKEEEE
jgi:cell division protein FtsB